MATKPAIPVNKKPAVATKQVPAPAKKASTVSTTSPKKPAVAVKAAGPAKASVKVPVKLAAKKVASTSPAKVTGNIVKLNARETKAFHGTKSMDDKAAIVAGAALKSSALPAAVKKTIVKEVQQGILAKANTAVAKANLIKAKERESAAKANLKKVDQQIKVTKSAKKVESPKTNAKKIGRHIGKAVARAAAVVERADGPKAAAPLKKIVKKIDAIVRKPSKIDVAVKKTGSDTKGYEAGSLDRYIDKVEKRADFDRTIGIVQPKIKQTAALLSAKPSIVEPNKPAVNQYANTPVQTNKYVPPVAPQAPAPATPALRIPAEISGDEAIAREKLLRDRFKSMTATAHTGH